MTLRCIESLAELDYPSVRVIVVENGSGDDSAKELWDRLRQVDPNAARVDYVADEGAPSFDAVDGASPEQARWILAVSPVNRGYAGGMNAGLRIARTLGGARYFWLLNNDLTVARDAVAQLVHRVEDDARIGLCGCLQLRADPSGVPTGDVLATGGFSYVPWLGHFSRLNEPNSCDPKHHARVEQRMYGAQGAAVFGTHAFVSDVGLLDESRFLFFEEQDWAVRARRHNYLVAYAPAAHVLHSIGTAVGVRSGRRGTPVISRYFLARSRLSFTRRWYPYAVPTVLAYQLAIVAYYCVRGRFDDARLALAGVRDAFTNQLRRFDELGAVSY